MSRLPNTLVCSRCQSIMTYAGLIRDRNSHLYMCPRCADRRHELLQATVRRTGACGFGFLTSFESGGRDIRFEHSATYDRDGRPMDGTRIDVGDEVLVEVDSEGRHAESVWWLAAGTTPAIVIHQRRKNYQPPHHPAPPPRHKPQPQGSYRPASYRGGGRQFGILTTLKADDWGFVTGDDAIGYFIHISDVGGSPLYEGMRLEFLPNETPRGRKVSQVRVL